MKESNLTTEGLEDIDAPDTPREPENFAVGDRVKIKGLSSAPELNGTM